MDMAIRRRGSAAEANVKKDLRPAGHESFFQFLSTAKIGKKSLISARKKIAAPAV